MWPLLTATWAAHEEKRSQSGEDSDESTHKMKKKKVLTKDPSAAYAAREEMMSHLNENAGPKTPANKSAKTASTDCRSPKSESKIGRRSKKIESPD